MPPAARAFPVTATGTTTVWTGRGLLYGVNLALTGAVAGTVGWGRARVFDGPASQNLILLNMAVNVPTSGVVMQTSDTKGPLFRPVEVERACIIVIDVGNAFLDTATVFASTENRLDADVAMFTDRTADVTLGELLALASALTGG